MFLCRACGKKLRDNLAQIPWLADRVDEAAVKETRVTLSLNQIGRTPRTEDEEESPVPFSEPAHDAYNSMRTTLMRWVRDFCDQLGVEFMPVDGIPHDFIGPVPKTGGRNRRIRPDYLPTIRDLACWLSAHHLDIVNSEDAPLVAHEIEQIVRDGLRVINPPHKTFAGRCPTKTPTENDPTAKCGVDMWIDWNDDTNRMHDFVICPRCKVTHDSQALRQNALAEAEHMLMTKSELIDIMEKFGQPLSANTFHQWRKRRKLVVRGWKRGSSITPHKIGNQDPAVYRFGDVRRLCEARQRRERAVKEKVG